MFNITDNKGFHITFENGWTVSVQWGGGNYISNRRNTCFGEVPASSDAEVAAWKDEEWHQFENDSVKGYQTPADVLAFMNFIAAKS